MRRRRRRWTCVRRSQHLFQLGRRTIFVVIVIIIVLLTDQFQATRTTAVVVIDDAVVDQYTQTPSDVSSTRRVGDVFEVISGITTAFCEYRFDQTGMIFGKVRKVENVPVQTHETLVDRIFSG